MKISVMSPFVVGCICPKKKSSTLFEFFVAKFANCLGISREIVKALCKNLLSNELVLI